MERTSIVITGRVVGRSLELASLFVPHGWIQFDVWSLSLPLCLDFLVIDGIEQTCAINTNGRL